MGEADKAELLCDDKFFNIHGLRRNCEMNYFHSFQPSMASREANKTELSKGTRTLVVWLLTHLVPKRGESVIELSRDRQGESKSLGKKVFKHQNIVKGTPPMEKNNLSSELLNSLISNLKLRANALRVRNANV